MPDPRIAPDVSTGEPRCCYDCPSYKGVASAHRVNAHCQVDGRRTSKNATCLPCLLAAHAEFVQLRARVAELERRRCGTCDRVDPIEGGRAWCRWNWRVTEAGTSCPDWRLRECAPAAVAGIEARETGT